MKNKDAGLILTILLVLLVMNFVLGGQTSTNIPKTLNLQGKLRYQNGTVITGTHNFTFSIYDSYTGGTKLWEEMQTVTVSSSGIYNVILGSNVSMDLDFDIPYYLEIKVDDEPPMTPRINLTSAPYTYRTPIAENLTCVYCMGNTVNVTQESDFMENATFENDVIIKGYLYGGSPVKITGGLNVTSGNVYINGNVLFVDAANGRVGVGTASPPDKLTVNGSLKVQNTSGTLALYVNDSTGYVGIGTTNPGAKLNIKEDYDPSTTETPNTLMIDRDSSVSNANVMLKIVARGDDTGAGDAILSLDSWNASISTLHGATAYIAAQPDTSGEQRTNLAFYLRDDINYKYPRNQPAGTSYLMDDSNVKLFIKYNGYIGIGTTSPAQKLDIRDTSPVGIHLRQTGTNKNDPAQIIMDESVDNSGKLWIVPGDDFDAGSAGDQLIIGDYASIIKNKTFQ